MKTLIAQNNNPSIERTELDSVAVTVIVTVRSRCYLNKFSETQRVILTDVSLEAIRVAADDRGVLMLCKIHF